jgi:hypothetical protein
VFIATPALEVAVDPGNGTEVVAVALVVLTDVEACRVFRTRTTMRQAATISVMEIPTTANLVPRFTMETLALHRDRLLELR